MAIGGHEGVLALFETARGRRHVETLAPAIEFTCAQARIELAEISVVAVDIGPGLFTGLRVGVATAKAMAHALRVPMIGISSLDLLAFSVRFTPRVIVAAIDARRGELFYAFYRQVPGGVQRVSEPQAGSPDDLASELLASGRGAPARRRRGPALPAALRGRPGRRAGGAVDVAPLRGTARAAGPRPGAAGGLGELLGARAAVPAQARRRDQLDHPPRGGRHERTAPGVGRPGRAGGADQPDAPTPPPRRAAHRGAGVPPPVVVRPVRERARPAGVALLRGGPRGTHAGGLRRDARQRGGRAHHQRGRRPRLAPPPHRHPPAAGAGQRGPGPGPPQPHARGAGEQPRRPGALPPLRVRARGHPQGLLPRDPRGRLDHVGPRHRPGALRRSAWRPSRPPSRAGRASRAWPGRRLRGDPHEEPRGVAGLRAHLRAGHRDVLRRDGRGRGGGRRGRALVGGVEPGRPARPLRRRGARDRGPGPHGGHHAR